MKREKGKKRILVHTCCAPCLIYPLELLESRGYEVVPFFYNPNVHPFSEYRRRYLTVVDFCESRVLELRVGSYDMERHLAAIAAGEVERAGRPPVTGRCARCFSMRLSRTASEARRLGIALFTTTLLVSPYQGRDLIGEAGESASIEQGIHFLFEDMSSGYTASVKAAREADMYRQSYCGCVYSEKERYQKGDPPRR